MRLTRITLLLALCLMLVSCGGSPGTINGNWSGTLTGTITTQNGAPVSMNFTATFNQTSPPNVDVTNLNAGTSCIGASNTVSSTFSNGVFNLGVVSFPGAFQNGMNLHGNLDGNTIKGNWTMTGGASNESCTSSGTFKLTRG